MKYTINVQGVCDCRGVFIDVDVRWPSSLRDARVFSQSRINKMLREENLPMMYKRLLPGDDKVPVCLLGDPAYPLQAQGKVADIELEAGHWIERYTKHYLCLFCVAQHL